MPLWLFNNDKMKNIYHIYQELFSLKFKTLYAGLFAIKRETNFFSWKLTLYGTDMGNITLVLEV